jgi:hypothetical protein
MSRHSNIVLVVWYQAYHYLYITYPITIGFIHHCCPVFLWPPCAPFGTARTLPDCAVVASQPSQSLCAAHGKGGFETSLRLVDKGNIAPYLQLFPKGFLLAPAAPLFTLSIKWEQIVESK